MYTPVCTHKCTHTHTHTHTHTQTGLVPLAVSLGSYFSHCIHKVCTCTCARTHLHCYVNSLYTIFGTNTNTHHTHRLVLLAVTSIGFSFAHCFHEVYMCMNVHTCCYVHSCTPYICHTYSTYMYTYSTLALLRKWNLVHNTYIHSCTCTVHLYARIQMKNIKHVYTHSQIHIYIASIPLNLFSAPAHPFN